MDSGVNMMCFTASYAVALALELFGLWTRPRWRRLLVVVAAGAGIVAHTWYLGRRAGLAPWAPLSSQHDWYLAAAWMLAVIYVAVVLYYPRASMGVFLLPVTLGLIAAARWASTEPLASFAAPRFWGRVHGVFLMLGAVAVLLGFVAGLMYLLQSCLAQTQIPSQRPLPPSQPRMVGARQQPLARRRRGVGRRRLLHRHPHPHGPDRLRRRPLDRPRGH